MFSNDLRLTPSTHRFRITVFGLLCLSGSLYCVMMILYFIMDHSLLTLTSTTDDAMRLLFTHQNYIEEKSMATRHRNTIEMLDNATALSQEKSNLFLINEQQERIVQRTKRESTQWSPLPSNSAPMLTAKIDSSKSVRTISNKDNQTPMSEATSNGYRSITSLIGAKINNHQTSAIRKSNDNHIHRIARNENLRPIKEQAELIRPQGTNPRLKTVINDKNYGNRPTGHTLLKQESSRDSLESSPMSSSSRPARKRNLTSVNNNFSSHHYLDHTKTQVRQNNGKQHRQDIDPIVVSSSNFSYSRPSVALSVNNYDNDQWKPIPDDYNGPVLPVQVDVVDGIYDSSAMEGTKYSPQRGRYSINTATGQLNGRKYLHNEKPLELQPTLTHKIYKRVLLCDKTLVSLDFAQNLKSEPRPFGMDNNLIDAEALNVINNDENIKHVRSSGSFKYHQNHSQNHNEMKAINRNHINSVLSESDPLVACDMWDLEKGLSSRKPPRETLRQAVRIDFHTIRDAINKCRALSEKILPPVELEHQSLELSPDDVASIFSVKRGLMPGTKWCGLGDSASSYNDLGTKKKIDICCRAHDHCPIRLKPFRQGYGILNLAIYTKSHCDCDEDFYRCLKSTRTKVADLLGNIYFNVLKLQCMQTEKLKICKSIKKVALGFEKCVKWEESPDKKVFRFIPAPVAY